MGTNERHSHSYNTTIRWHVIEMGVFKGFILYAVGTNVARTSRYISRAVHCLGRVAILNRVVNSRRIYQRRQKWVRLDFAATIAGLRMEAPKSGYTKWAAVSIFSFSWYGLIPLCFCPFLSQKGMLWKRIEARPNWGKQTQFFCNGIDGIQEMKMQTTNQQQRKKGNGYSQTVSVPHSFTKPRFHPQCGLDGEFQYKRMRCWSQPCSRRAGVDGGMHLWLIR